MPNPAERAPVEAQPTSAEAQPASNGLGISPRAVPLYRRVGRRWLQLIRPLALPFLARLQSRVSLGVDASFSAQVLRQVLSELQAINAERQASNARLETMADTIQMLHRTVEGLNLNVDKISGKCSPSNKPSMRSGKLAIRGWGRWQIRYKCCIGRLRASI